MSKITELIPIFGTNNLDRHGDVIFVHGLNGDGRGTWHPEEKKNENPRSLNGTHLISVEFYNRTQKYIKLFWIDYEGKIQWFTTLKPKARHKVNTYLTHPWLIVDEQDKILKIYYPEVNSTWGQAEIRVI